MKNHTTVFLLVSITFLIGCDEENLIEQIDVFDEMPGKYIDEMAIDNTNEFYFVTNEIDNSIDNPIWSCSFPMKCYLSKRESEISEFEILDDNFIPVEEIIFDKNNNLWARNRKTIFLREGQTMKKILELSDDDGSFYFFAIDHEDNIWAGGSTRGLYKIDRELNIELFTPENSALPTSFMNNIHIDSKNNIWIALNGGVLNPDYS